MYFRLLVPVTTKKFTLDIGTVGEVDISSLVRGTNFPYAEFKVNNETLKVKVEWLEFHEIDSTNPEETSYLINLSKEVESHKYVIFYDLHRFRNYGFYFENEKNLENKLWGPKALTIRKVFNQLVLSIANEAKIKVCFIEDSRDYFYLNILEGNEMLESKAFDDLFDLQDYVGMSEGA